MFGHSLEESIPLTKSSFSDDISSTTQLPALPILLELVYREVSNRRLLAVFSLHCCADQAAMRPHAVRCH